MTVLRTFYNIMRAAGFFHWKLLPARKGDRNKRPRSNDVPSLEPGSRRWWKQQFDLRDRTIRGLGFRYYSDYLFDPGYARRKAAVLRRADGRCEECGEARPVEVHHLHYETLGAEHPTDLRALCSWCHGLIHDGTAFRLSMRTASQAVDPPVAPTGWFNRRPEDRLFVRWLEKDGWRRRVAIFMHGVTLVTVFVFLPFGSLALLWAIGRVMD